MLNKEFEPALLLQQKRSKLTELEYYGFIKFIDKNGKAFGIGKDNDYPFFHRSCAKPLQASLIADFDTVNYFNMNSQEIAVCCASHTGEPMHVEILRNLLVKGGFSEKDLKCPVIPPLNKEEQLKFSVYSPLHNNCSGKHSLMLLLCRENGWETESYLCPEHPLQKLICMKIAELAEEKNNLEMTYDGCNAPNWATSLNGLARAFGNLFLNYKYLDIRKAFVENPYLIGGKDRFDTDLMLYSKDIIAKVGAGGLCAAVNLKTNESLAVKVIDADMKARSIIVIEAMRQIGWLNNKSIDENLLKIYSKDVCTQTGIKVGEITPCFSF